MSTHRAITRRWNGIRETLTRRSHRRRRTLSSEIFLRARNTSSDRRPEIPGARRRSPGARLRGAAADEASADGRARGRLPGGGGPRLEQPLGEVVLLRPAPLLAAAHAVALDLALEYGERLLEGQAETLGRDVGVKLGPARQVPGDRAARDRPTPAPRPRGAPAARPRPGHAQ